MKEQMKKQYVQSDHDWKLVSLNRDNAIREYEVLR